MPGVIASGTIIADRYRLESLLGQGGMGLVWQATHLVTRRSVAIKFIRGSLAERPEIRRRFLREARAASAVAHPNVVELLDVFELEDATPVMVMELLRGETLRRRLDRARTLELRQAADIFLPIVSAVGAAHARGIVHRDLKPENVFLTGTGPVSGVKVLDFGIAKFAVRDELDGTDATTTGGMFGTPGYMAPEQGFAEKGIDHLADVWSLGAMLYEALVGRRPVEGQHLGQVLKQLMSQPIAPIGDAAPGLPLDVSSLVMSMLAHQKERRPRDLREVHRVLSRYAETSAPSFSAPASNETDVETAVSDLDGSSVDGAVHATLLGTVTLPPAQATERVVTMTPRPAQHVRTRAANRRVSWPVAVVIAASTALAIGGWHEWQNAPAVAAEPTVVRGSPPREASPPPSFFPPTPGPAVTPPGSVGAAPAASSGHASSVAPAASNRRANAAPEIRATPSLKIDRMNPY